MKPSKSYFQRRKATATDIVHFVETKTGCNTFPKPPQAYDNPFTTWLKKWFFYVPQEDLFAYYSTITAERLIDNFKREFPKPTAQHYEYAIAEIAEKQSRLGAASKKIIMQATAGYFTGKPAAVGSIETLLYGEFVMFRQWLQDQLNGQTATPNKVTTYANSQGEALADKLQRVLHNNSLMALAESVKGVQDMAHKFMPFRVNKDLEDISRQTKPKQPEALPEHQPEIVRVPHFTNEAKQAICSALQPFLSADDAEVLPQVLEGTQPAIPLKTIGLPAKSLAVMMREAYESNHITGIEKRHLAQWIYRCFEFERATTENSILEYLKPYTTVRKSDRLPLHLKKLLR